MGASLVEQTRGLRAAVRRKPAVAHALELHRALVGGQLRLASRLAAPGVVGAHGSAALVRGTHGTPC
jgi:hypothetical protein